MVRDIENGSQIPDHSKDENWKAKVPVERDGQPKWENKRYSRVPCSVCGCIAEERPLAVDRS